jgi:hypothetical protein
MYIGGGFWRLRDNKIRNFAHEILIKFPAINFGLILGHNTSIRIRNAEPVAGSGIRIRN